ncbi:MAG: cupin domain-containing protein [Anaerolineae bacterium]
MKKERVVKVDEIMGYSPKGLENSYISKLLIESDGVGSARLMLTHSTLGVGKDLGEFGVHPEPYDEIYYVLHGKGRMEFGDGDTYEVGPHTAVFIAAGTPHTMANIGDVDLEFLSIWPVLPAEEGINGTYDQRKKEWGTSFRKK